MTFFKASWLLALALRDDHLKFEVKSNQTKGSKKRWKSPMGNIQNIQKNMGNHHVQWEIHHFYGDFQWTSPMDKQIVDPL
jgi:hypothetical protein